MRKMILALSAGAMLVLAGCASFDFSNPADDLHAAEAGFAVAEATYDAICSVNNPPNFCTEPQAVSLYHDSKAALEAAFKTADDALNAGTLDQASVTKLVQDAVTLLVRFEAIVNDTKAKKAAYDQARVGAYLSPGMAAGIKLARSF